MRSLHVGFRRAVPHATRLVLASILAAALVLADEATVFLAGPATNVTAGEAASIWLHLLNTTDHPVTPVFPARLEVRLTAGATNLTTMAELRNPPAPEPAIAPGAFVRREYALVVPRGIEGAGSLSAPSMSPSAAVIVVRHPPEPVAKSNEPPKAGAGLEAPDKAEGTKKLAYDPVEFFKRHFSAYEPFYFIAGLDSPNAKFQLSFKYQILNEDGALAEHAPVLKGVHFAFTQTSLWDWNEPSAPFLDSSYKPELFYSMNVADRGGRTDHFRLDLQGGVQHESNGRDGASSRSLNMFYLRPSFAFGPRDGLQLTLTPRVWVYLPDLYDNPDLPSYRGYADLRATLGWLDGLQLASMVRVGDGADKGSLTLDLTYPMSRLATRSFSLYLHAQYFTGYGESFLLYKERSSAVRVGFTLFR